LAFCRANGLPEEDTDMKNIRREMNKRIEEEFTPERKRDQKMREKMERS
jgi:hypothetical protein